MATGSSYHHPGGREFRDLCGIDGICQPDFSVATEISPSSNRSGAGRVAKLLADAGKYFNETGRHYLNYGEIGELFMEEKRGLVRNRPGAQGSDGKIGGRLVEVKTMPPHKERPVVEVTKAKNFQILAVVRVFPDFSVEVRFLRRKRLPKDPNAKCWNIGWDSELFEPPGNLFPEVATTTSPGNSGGSSCPRP